MKYFLGYKQPKIFYRQLSKPKENTENSISDLREE